MPGSLGNVFSSVHWAVALQTGLATASLALLISFTPLGRLYDSRYGNALLVGALTALGDGYLHAGRDGIRYVEAAATGAVSGLLALAASFLFEDRARRLLAAWSRITGMLTSTRP
jgi:hypothetical protein